MEKQKILVTGGAGYIGSHTIAGLLEHPGFSVISADNFINSSPAVFEGIEKISGQHVPNYNVDLKDFAAVKEIFEKEKDIKGVIHFAALKSVPESVANPQLYFENNNGSLRNLLDCCRNFGVNYFIFSSSCSVYGNIKQLPVSEETPLGLAESPYAKTKQDGEKMLKEFAENNPSVKCVALRYFNPAGAHPSGLIGESPLKPPDNLVPVITRTATGRIPETVVFGNDYPTRDGTCIRDYVHVCDIADAHVKALEFLMQNGKENSILHVKEYVKTQESAKQNYFVFNLGTGRGVSVLEAIHAFEKVSGKKLNYRIGPRRKGDVEAVYSDCSKAERMLGWKPKYGIEDMMATAWKWELHCLSS